MSFKVKSFTIAPALILYFVAASLSLFAIAGVAETLVLEQKFWDWAFAAFLIGSALTCCWAIYWGLYKKLSQTA